MAGEIPGGASDPRNIQISVIENGSRIKVSEPDGSVKIYYRPRGDNKIYWIEKEILPNGKILRYPFNYQLNTISTIQSLDPQERYLYGTIDIEFSSKNMHFTASTGQSVDYIYKVHRFEGKYKIGKEKFWYDKLTPPFLISVNSPNFPNETLGYDEEHLLLNAYSGRDEVFNNVHAVFGGATGHYKVQKLLLPVAENDGFETFCQIDYDSPIPKSKTGKTTVTFHDASSTVYHFSDDLLITSIQYFNEYGQLKKEKIYKWTSNNWLEAIFLKDGNQNLLHKKSYEYDTFGNPVLEVFTGDLTGEGHEDSYSINRKFSDDGRNLLLREESEDGKVVTYEYLPNTNLVTLKKTLDREKVLIQEINQYDDAHNLIRTSLEGVSSTQFTEYIPKAEPPFQHLPEWVEEKYQEKDEEKLLKRSHLFYDSLGNVRQEDIYDSEGKFAYSILKEYNPRGDLLSETNPLGQKALYTYDTRGRPKSSTNFSQNIQKEMTYDLRGRLREETEITQDKVRTQRYHYDFNDCLIQKRDAYHNLTSYTYQTLIKQPVKITHPPISSPSGDPVEVVILTEYDPFGRKIKETDANGNSTQFRYNAYGSVVEITDPEGHQEQFFYFKNGKLKTHIDKEGLSTHYEYDVLGRALSKIYLSKEQVPLAQESFTYDSFNLLTHTNKEGHLTKYTYDGAGRKIRENFSGKITEFVYDPLGYISHVIHHNDDNTLYIQYKRDLEGRVLEEIKTDTRGQILFQIAYTYDVDGNRQTITRSINGKEAIETFYYDPFQREIQHTDALGFTTFTQYNEDFSNPLGQKVLQRTTTDPHHISRVQTYDTLGRPVQKDTLNASGKILASQESIYDPSGNLLLQKDHVFHNETYQKTQFICYSYTPLNQIQTLTRAFNTPLARTIAFTYTPSNKIQTKTLASGITLTYAYDDFGYLKQLDSIRRSNRLHF